MTCAEFQCECRRYRALHGEIGLGTELSRADACAEHRRECGCCAQWYRDRLEEERPLLLMVR